MIRILVIAFHDGMKAKSFDSHDNLKQLTGLLGDLNHLYLQIKLNNKEMKTCRSEMLCYQIIATAKSPQELMALLMQHHESLDS